MSYILHNTDLATFSFVAGRQPESNIGLKGHLDMPALSGKTFHSWRDSSSIEPYVSAGEISFGGRDLSLTGFIKGANRKDCLQKAEILEAFIDGLTDLVLLECKWGNFSVYVKMIVGAYKSDGVLRTTIVMREPIVDMNGVVPDPTDSVFGIDGISFNSLGGIVMTMIYDRYSRPQIKEQYFTAFENEGFQVSRAEAKRLNMSVFIKADGYVRFKEKILTLMALFASEGIRKIHIPNDRERSVFLTDGFTVSRFYSSPERCVGIVEFSALEVEPQNDKSDVDYYFYVDDDRFLSVTYPDGASYSFELDENGELFITDGVTTSLGRVGINPRGDWSAMEAYKYLDLISYEGSSYLVKIKTSTVPAGTSPLNTIYFQTFAQEGDKGNDA